MASARARTTVGFDAIPGLLGSGRRHDPADMAFFGQRAIEPVPTEACLIDSDEMLAIRLHLPDELIDVTLSCTDVAQGDDVGVLLGDVGNGNRLFMDIQSDVKRARLVHS